MKFRENLINLRKREGLSQDELSEKLNISRQTISKWENETTTPDFENLVKMSQVFGITVNELIGEEIKTENNNSNKETKETIERRIPKKTKIILAVILIIVIFTIEMLYKFVFISKIDKIERQQEEIMNYHYQKEREEDA